MKKIISIVGARPNFMKVAPIDRELKKHKDKFIHLICHTGQHYDRNMSDTFFEDLKMPQPDFFLNAGSGSHAEQTAKVMVEFEKVCIAEKPDLVIVVGDVNSTIACTLTAAKLGIKTAHVEAGLRSFDRAMPEELNRIATDSLCDYLFVTEESGLENLSHDGVNPEKVFFVGNTMIDSLYNALPFADASNVLNELSLVPKEYTLVTIHRPSNVDDEQSLKDIFEIITYLSNKRKVVFPVHPRTLKNLKNYGLDSKIDKHKIRLIEPQGYIKFLALMKNSDFVLTDSGGIQEETTVLGIPCITARTTTERPVTITLGTNLLVNPDKEGIIKAIESLLKYPRKKGTIPPLWDGNAAQRITNVLINRIFK